MNDSRTIWLVRHGMREDFMRPEWRNTAERPHDTPLSEEGWQQARETGLFRGVDDVCFKLCGLTGWRGTPGNWQSIYSGVDHLSFTEDAVKFH